MVFTAPKAVPYDERERAPLACVVSLLLPAGPTAWWAHSSVVLKRSEPPESPETADHFTRLVG